MEEELRGNAAKLVAECLAQCGETNQYFYRPRLDDQEIRRLESDLRQRQLDCADKVLASAQPFPFARAIFYQMMALNLELKGLDEKKTGNRSLYEEELLYFERSHGSVSYFHCFLPDDAESIIGYAFASRIRDSQLTRPEVGFDTAEARAMLNLWQRYQPNEFRVYFERLLEDRPEEAVKILKHFGFRDHYRTSEQSELSDTYDSLNGQFDPEILVRALKVSFPSSLNNDQLTDVPSIVRNFLWEKERRESVESAAR
jgi:hypothetical protein